jgi:hypothetical protein
MAFEVTQHSKVIVSQLTVDTAAYAIGDCMGGKITLSNVIRKANGRATLTDLVVIDESNVKPVFNIVIFGANPTAATLTDNAAVALSTDTKKIIAVVPVYSSDYLTVAGTSVATIQLGNIILQPDVLNTTTTLYAAVVATAANDMVATDDLILKFGLIQD